MPIQTQDIKIFESDTMNDADQGGGAMTGNVIIDGASNNIFEDISTLDRVYGAVHMRKVFPAVQIQTQDKYFGAHAIISKLPGDSKIGVNLFSTEDWFDRRPSAKSRVENYMAKGANYSGFLWATQWKDSKVLSIFQSETAPIPGVGDVLYLTQSSETQTQFIKITKIEESVQEFTDASGVFKRRILAIEISQPLEYDFVGAQISRFDTITPAATIKQTVVANAAKYFSARPLALAGAAEDLSVKVDTVYSQVIPSSLQELAITDADANGMVAALVKSAQGTVSFTVGDTFSPNFNLYLGSPCTPGTLSIPVSGGTIIDDGGQIKIDGAATSIGTINYAAGTITFGATSPTYTGSKTVTFEPSAAPTKIADTGMLAVTAANRGYVWTYNINPAPKPGSVTVSYRSLGNWFTLYDNGGGGLFGQESGIGSGTINYITGSLSATLAALPDADSEIIITWARDARYRNRSNITPDKMRVVHHLQHQGIARGTLTITWNDGTARTATAANDGTISGDGTGTVNHSTGKVEFYPNTLPLGGTDFTFDYQYGTPLSQTFNAPVKDGSGNLVLDLGELGLLENSIELTWNVSPDSLTYASTQSLLNQSLDGYKTARDDGLGALEGFAGSVVDYVNGTITFDPDVTVNMPAPTYATVHKGYEPTGLGANGAFSQPRAVYEQVYTGIQDINVFAPFPQDSSGSVTVLYRKSDSPQVAQEVVTLSTIELDLTTGYAETIVPGSVRFVFGGETFVDREGQVYANISPTTGAGTYSGSIDYTTGNIVLTSWNTGAANSISLKSLTTELGKEPVTGITFRIPSAPVKTQSLQIRAVPADGGSQLSATANATGYITGTDIDGWITYETGVVFVRFGTWVAAAGNEGESWYDPNAIAEDGKIFKPRHVYADTLFYNAVSQTFLPLDSDILGLNPVRLPQDGRIPVYAEGDVVVILHDQVTIGTYANNDVTDLGRGRIAKLSVRDAANQEILATRYIADLDAGTITWVDLAGVSQPLTITDRIEDMAILTDVQITGTLTLSQPLTHNFPADEALVANAVVFGDLFAHTSVPFDQQTWTGAWSDSLIGSGVSAQFNNTQYPIVVDNASAIQERWAIIFTGATTVNVIGENVGQILTSVSITADIAPLNPNTNQPYFTIPTGGWGSGWATGNVLRFNTYAANAPVWIIQSVAQGESTDTDYTFCLEVRGDIDTP